MNLHRRLEALENEVVTGVIVLQMPDRRTETIRGHGDYLPDLLARACRGERTPETELIAQSISSTEPGGGQMIDLARAILNDYRLKAGRMGTTESRGGG
jgi:hypothetical protein